MKFCVDYISRVILFNSKCILASITCHDIKIPLRQKVVTSPLLKALPCIWKVGQPGGDIASCTCAIKTNPASHFGRTTTLSLYSGGFDVWWLHRKYFIIVGYYFFIEKFHIPFNFLLPASSGCQCYAGNTSGEDPASAGLHPILIKSVFSTSLRKAPEDWSSIGKMNFNNNTHAPWLAFCRHSWQSFGKRNFVEELPQKYSAPRFLSFFIIIFHLSVLYSFMPFGRISFFLDNTLHSKKLNKTVSLRYN